MRSSNIYIYIYTHVYIYIYIYIYNYDSMYKDIVDKVLIQLNTYMSSFIDVLNGSTIIEQLLLLL